MKASKILVRSFEEKLKRVDPDITSLSEDDFEDALDEFMYELREGEFETNIPPDYSRHYESYSVGVKVDIPEYNGYIGWTYWYGGGKHGNPEEIEWVSDAYFLNLEKEEEITIIKRTFSKE